MYVKVVAIRDSFDAWVEDNLAKSVVEVAEVDSVATLVAHFSHNITTLVQAWVVALVLVNGVNEHPVGHDVLIWVTHFARKFSVDRVSVDGCDQARVSYCELDFVGCSALKLTITKSSTGLHLDDVRRRANHAEVSHLNLNSWNLLVDRQASDDRRVSNDAVGVRSAVDVRGHSSEWLEVSRCGPYKCAHLCSDIGEFKVSDAALVLVVHNEGLAFSCVSALRECA